MECPRPRNRATAPYCTSHAREWQYKEKAGTIANACGVFRTKPGWDLALQLVGRWSALLANDRYTPPDAAEMREVMR